MGSENKLLWRIGRHDKSFSEFAIAGKPELYLRSFPNDVLFIVGESREKEDWPYIHPGLSDWAGGRVHPFKIKFYLDDEVGDVEATLNIAYIDVVRHMLGRPYLGDGPNLGITINGVKQMVHFPKDSSSNNTQSLWDPTKGKCGIVSIPFSGTLLKKGENSITLTVEEDGWIIYDALWLEINKSKKLNGKHIAEFQARETLLFKKHGNRLRQAIEVEVLNLGRPVNASVTVKIGGYRLRENVLLEFGRSVNRFLIPEITRRDYLEVEIETDRQKLSGKFPVKPRKKWLLFLAPAAHTDVGYTTIQPHVAEVHNRNIDLAIEACKRTPSFKWNIECSWQVKNYLESRKNLVDDLLRLIKGNRIEVQALYTNLLTGICNHESLSRICYPSFNLKRLYGVPIRSAMLTDIPTAIWTLSTVLANSGVKYLAQGINQNRGAFLRDSDVKPPLYLEGPDGSKILVWFSDHYGIRQAARAGLFDEYEDALRRVQRFIEEFEITDYPYDAILIHGAYADNHMLDPRFAKLVEKWNREWDYPRIIIACLSEFFKYIEERFGSKLPIYRGDAGCYWEDGVASTARETSIHRSNQERILSAEKLHSISTLIDRQQEYPYELFDKAWDLIHLFNEHTWGDAWSSLKPESKTVEDEWEWKKGCAYYAKNLIDDLLETGLKRLSSNVAGGRHYSLLVFNPFSWIRDDFIEVIISCPPFADPFQDFELIDARDGRNVEYQVLEEGAGTVFNVSGYRMWRRLMIFVRDLPPLGYMCIDVLPKRYGGSGSGGESIRFFKYGIENQYYRIEFDESTGAIKSIYDKELDKELVDQEAVYHLNEYLYVTGREGGRVELSPLLPPPKLKIHRAELIEISQGQSGPIFGSMMIKRRCKRTPTIDTEVRLYSKLKRIEIINRLWKEETLESEAAYFVFPFAYRRPEIRFEIPDGFMRPEVDQLKGGCRDHYCVLNWLAISDGSTTVIWNSVDAPLISINDINVGKWLKKLDMENGTIFSYVMNNYWKTNYKASQGGRFTFRYNLTSHGGGVDNVKATRFGWSCSHPPLHHFVIPDNKGPLPHEGMSFLEVEDSNVVVTALKMSETRDGVIFRLLEMGGKATTSMIKFRGLEFKEAWLCNLVEEPMRKLKVENGSVEVPIAARGLATVKLIPKG